MKKLDFFYCSVKSSAVVLIGGVTVRHQLSKLFACWVILHTFFASTDLFQNDFLKKILSGTLPECQTVWIQIRTDRMSILIWVQTVGKVYLQTTLVGKELINLMALFFSPKKKLFIDQ